MIKFKHASILMFSLMFLAACFDSDSNGSGSNASCEGVAKPNLEANEEFAENFSQVAGTYNLTFSPSGNGNPEYADGEQIDFEITEDGALVIAGEMVLCHPVLFNGNPAEANWKDTDNDFLYGVSDLENGFNEINYASGGVPGDQNFTFLGQFVE